MLTTLLDKIKQPQVLTFLVMIIVNVAARYGLQMDSAEVQSSIVNIIDALTWISGLVVAYQSSHKSLL